jgi:hypothetical protein
MLMKFRTSTCWTGTLVPIAKDLSFSVKRCVHAEPRKSQAHAGANAEARKGCADEEDQPIKGQQLMAKHTVPRIGRS